MQQTKDFLNNLPKEQRNTFLARFGCSSLNIALFMARWKPIMSIAFNILFILAVSAFPALAQGPNPWGGSGTTKVSNFVNNILVAATWSTGVIGILSFILIPIFIKFEWNWKKLLMSGFTGIGLFAVIGSFAYDLVNLSSVDMPDTTIGH